jgi:hypothetical protein
VTPGFNTYPQYLQVGLIGTRIAAAGHPRATGVVLAGEEALHLGIDIFGRLLAE